MAGHHWLKVTGANTEDAGEGFAPCHRLPSGYEEARIQSTHCLV